MSSDHQAEIRASVEARHDLGPGYDEALAEGLVERIGAEIDKRIEAQLRRYGVPSAPAFGPDGAAEAPAPPGPEPVLPPGYPAAAGYLPGGYQGYQGHPGYPWYPGYPGYQAPLLPPGPPPGYQVPVAVARPPARPTGLHSAATAVVALGSMTLGVAATAVLAHAQDVGGRAALALVIWAAIVIINIAYARRS